MDPVHFGGECGKKGQLLFPLPLCPSHQIEVLIASSAADVANEISAAPKVAKHKCSRLLCQLPRGSCVQTYDQVEVKLPAIPLRGRKIKDLSQKQTL